MAYATYTTEALVCGSTASHTSDRSYLLFTREAGMLWATAKSVREEKSKQRYALQDFSFIRVSLVKGKTGWRVGSVEAVGNPFMKARSRSERAFIKNVVTLLRRYIHGEQSIPSVYDDVASVLLNPIGSVDVLYTVFTFRLLHALGYIDAATTTSTVLEAPNAVIAATADVQPSLGQLEKQIARAQHVSQL